MSSAQPELNQVNLNLHSPTTRPEALRADGNETAKTRHQCISTRHPTKDEKLDFDGGFRLPGLPGPWRRVARVSDYVT